MSPGDGAAERGVFQEFDDLQIERQQLVVNKPLVFEHGARHNGHFVSLRVGRIDDRELQSADVLDENGRFALADIHLRFDVQEVHDQFIGHHEPHPGVQQHDAGPFAKHQRAAGQQYEPGQATFDQLPQNAH